VLSLTVVSVCVIDVRAIFSIINEINNTNSAVKNVIGVYPTLLRPPYGNINDRVNNLINMNIILWNVDTLDWKYRDANRIKDEIVKSASDGAIVLLHDLYETSIDGVILAMDELITQGYAFVTIDEMAELKGVKLNSSKVYRYIE
jgi:peptidoglycan/xylan/chitin deacetylase (PgdA/CDA1 family)